MSFPTAEGPREFPVDRCRGRAAARTEIRVHFLHIHIWNTVVILEEGNLPHPRCPQCDLLVPWKALNGRHTKTAHCTKVVERKRCRLVMEEMREIAARAFQAYGRSLETFPSFK